VTRRSFVSSTACAFAAAAATPLSEVPLGLDLFSIRSQKWDAFQYLDYAAKWGIQAVHFSEIRFLGDLDNDDHVRKVGERAKQLNIRVELGMRSACPTSKAFDAKAGTAEQQIAKMLHAAKLAGSPIVRCFLGTSADREGDGGIDRNIETMVKTLRAAKSRIVNAGLKMAVENHAGDMQARELKTLVEGAGKDFVGVCLDSGNPLWAIEDPHLTLETLAPYVVTSHVRDTAVWRVPEGAAVAWTRMGDGNIGIDDYVRKYSELCPGRPLSLEIIVTGPRIYPFLNPKFWGPYKNQPAWEFNRFLALAERGTPRPVEPPLSPEQSVVREREDLEASIKYTKALLGKP
jgi:sugar phosphate isomerase/epimerase